MNTGAQASRNNQVRTVIILVSVALALLVTLICVVDIILVRRRMSARPTAEIQSLAQASAVPKSIPTMAPPTQAGPAAVDPTVTPAPPPTTAPSTTTWRFLRINAEDIGTFQNVADPNQRLLAKCIDPSRPPPNKGAIYILGQDGILKLESGGKKYQRFKVTSGQ